MEHSPEGIVTDVEQFGYGIDRHLPAQRQDEGLEQLGEAGLFV